MTIIDQAGIYGILNAVSGRWYIGSAKNLHQRWNEHRSTLNRGIHRNRKLQNSWNLHGADAFSFSPVLLCSKENLVLYEQLCIGAFDAVKAGYNIAPIAKSNLGIKHTEQSKENYRRGAVGRKMPPMSTEAKLAHSVSMKGKKFPPISEKTREKLRAASLGRGKGVPLTMAHREKLRLAKLGTKQSDEHRLKISVALKRFWASRGS